MDSSPCFRKAQNDKKETLMFKGFFAVKGNFQHSQVA